MLGFLDCGIEKKRYAPRNPRIGLGNCSCEARNNCGSERKIALLGVFEGAAGENFEDSGSQTECSRCKIASKSVKNTLEM